VSFIAPHTHSLLGFKACDDNSQQRCSLCFVDNVQELDRSISKQRWLDKTLENGRSRTWAYETYINP
jgi:hypothetical protein